MANSKKDVQRIDNMNDIGGKIVKKQREELIKQNSGASQNEFQDEKIKLNSQSQQMFKEKFRR
jgi:hypothetical protein